MTTNWIPRLARRLAALFDASSIQSMQTYPPEYDRDEERMRRELELIRLRFPHHS